MRNQEATVRPEEIGCLRYYVVRPINNTVSCLAEFFASIRIKAIGGWYCEYCRTIHGRRTYKFRMRLMQYDMLYRLSVDQSGTLGDVSNEGYRFTCSLGRDAYNDNKWHPTAFNTSPGAKDEGGESTRC